MDQSDLFHGDNPCVELMIDDDDLGYLKVPQSRQQTLYMMHTCGGMRICVWSDPETPM